MMKMRRGRSPPSRASGVDVSRSIRPLAVRSSSHLSQSGYAKSSVSDALFRRPAIGMRATIRKTVENEDVIGFAELSGDHNPIHLSEHFARKTRFGGRIVHGLYTASLISAVIGMRLPGPGAVYISQTLNFLGPSRLATSWTSASRWSELTEKKRRVRLHCECRVGDRLVLDGEGVLSVPPTPKPRHPRLTLDARAVAGLRNAGYGTAESLDRQDAMTSGFVLATDPMLPPHGLEGAVYAIGNFDGLHLGHQAVIERAVAHGEGESGPQRPPDVRAPSRRLLRRTAGRVSIDPAGDKAAICAAAWPDGIVLIHFDAALAAMTADEFVANVLVARLGASAVIVGWDFHFGKGRSGSPATLAEAGASATASASRLSPRWKTSAGVSPRAPFARRSSGAISPPRREVSAATIRFQAK